MSEKTHEVLSELDFIHFLNVDPGCQFAIKLLRYGLPWKTRQSSNFALPFTEEWNMRLNSRTIFSGALLTLLMTCLAAARASAQDITGTIVGLVRDAGGAAIAGATVTIRRQR